ncbi:RNA chaperone Hfq [Bacillus cereus]
MERKAKTFQKNRNENAVSLQDQVLQEVVQTKQNIIMILVNGFHIKGTVKGYDSYSILIEWEGKQQLIYKHVISTIRI